MELKLVRGFVADLTPADKNGRVVCRIGAQAVRLHSDLSSGAKAGDEVLIGGELHNDVVHAVALKNFSQRQRLYKVDFTFHILGAGFGTMLTFFGLIFLAQSTAGAFFGNLALDLILITVGTSIAFFALHRLPRINRLTRWVDNVKE